SLTNEGRVIVSSEQLGASDENALSLLRDLHKRAQAELSSEPPDFSPVAALWAAELLYQVCQFTVCRELGEDLIANAFANACPEPHNPASDWSVDLTLRHLPALFRLARHLSSGDPLVQAMGQLAAEWPLSSVGIAELSALNLDCFITHPSLARLYADRIV